MPLPTLDSRERQLWLVSLLFAASACGAGAPAGPIAAPQPVAATMDSVRKSSPKPIAGRPIASSTPARVGARKPAAVDSAALELAVTKAHAHWPLAVALARRSGNPEVAVPAAAALIYQAARLRLSPSLLGAVLLIENTPLEPGAVKAIQWLCSGEEHSALPPIPGPGTEYGLTIAPGDPGDRGRPENRSSGGAGSGAAEEEVGTSAAGNELGFSGN